MIGYATLYTFAPVFTLVLDRDVDEPLADRVAAPHIEGAAFDAEFGAEPGQFGGVAAGDNRP